MEQITIDDLIDKTIDSIKRKGVDNSLPVIYRLYNYILLNIEELPQIKRKQTAGMTFAFLSYRKLSGCTKFPAMAYYCLTQATKHLPVFFPFHLVSTYIITSTAERVKFLLFN